MLVIHVHRLAWFLLTANRRILFAIQVERRNDDARSKNLATALLGVKHRASAAPGRLIPKLFLGDKANSPFLELDERLHYFTNILGTTADCLDLVTYLFKSHTPINTTVAMAPRITSSCPLISSSPCIVLGRLPSRAKD